MFRQIIRIPGTLLIVTLIIFVYRNVIDVNSTTVALTLLLAILGMATLWGLKEAIVASVAGMLGFNFFFLPPVGTLTIADPQNWVALFAFLVTAVSGSELSARAKRRAIEARPVPHRELLQAVWGPDYGDQSDYLRVFVTHLRKKLEPDTAHPRYILTEPWIGYRFT